MRTVALRAWTKTKTYKSIMLVFLDVEQVYTHLFNFVFVAILAMNFGYIYCFNVFLKTDIHDIRTCISIRINAATYAKPNCDA